MSLTTTYLSFSDVLFRNKYEVASHTLNLGYKRITGKDAFPSDLPVKLKQFIMEYDEVVALPNWFKNEVVSLLLRPISKKTFRYYSEFNIPYGSGISDKPYDKPWVIVESCLDSDFLRGYYPYVIATLGVTVSNFLQEFVFDTAPFVIVGFDNDEAGNIAYNRLCYKYKGRIKRLLPPLNNKDFGDTLQHLCTNDLLQFDFESSLIKTSLQVLTGNIC